jgi:hypothetical protein
VQAKCAVSACRQLERTLRPEVRALSFQLRLAGLHYHINPGSLCTHYEERITQLSSVCSPSLALSRPSLLHASSRLTGAGRSPAAMPRCYRPRGPSKDLWVHRHQRG